MALTSADSFTETTDIGNYFWDGLQISAGIAYYGTLKTEATDNRDFFVFRPSETGEYRLSWENSLVGGEVILYVNPNLTILEEVFVDADAGIDGGTQVELVAGAIYLLSISDGTSARDGFSYGFEFVLGEVIDDNGIEQIGGPEGDSLEGGLGPDRLIGRGGNDSLLGAEGFDLLVGGNGNDFLDAGRDGGRLFGGSGHDLMTGGHIDLEAYGGKGRDELHVVGVTGQNVVADLGNGNDSLHCSVGAVSKILVRLGAGNDWMSSSPARSQSGESIHIIAEDAAFYGGAGRDYMTGVGRLYGGEDRDMIYGAEDSLVTSILDGGAGDDLIYAGTHLDALGDRLFGGAGRDYLQGDSGRDTLVGGLGKDRISSGFGRDVIRLGDDFGAGDVVVYTQTAFSSFLRGRDKIFGFESGQDRIDLAYVAELPNNHLPTGLEFSDTRAAARSVWYEISDIVTYVRADLDGDAVADMEIMVFGVGALNESDFIL